MPLGESKSLGGRSRTKAKDESVGRRGIAVYDAICQSIRLQQFRPGERIVEDTIATTLGTSRTPVREALLRLRARGLIQPAEGGGFEIARLGREEMNELYAYRTTLEGAVGRAAAQHATDADIEAMTHLNEEFLRSWGDVTEVMQANRRFHSFIYQTAHNRYLARALDDLFDHLAILGGTTLSEAGRFRAAYEEHKALIAAIAERNPDVAEEISRRHVTTAQRRRLTMFASAG